MNNSILSTLLKGTAVSGAALGLLLAVGMAPQVVGEECPEVLRHEMRALQTGNIQNLCEYKGKVVLVVNTASFCAYTAQYEALEAVYRQYRDEGLVVLGFPSNDFGAQEPGSNQEVAQFCGLTYGVEFPTFEKSSVVGTSSNALYTQLHEMTGETPRWNFHKYLIARDGQRVLSFPSTVSPDDPTLLQQVRELLKQHASHATRL